MSQEEKKRCHSCFLMLRDCKLTLAMLELIGQTEAQAEALAREWCCWDAIDNGSFATGQWNPPCLHVWF